ncbi:acyltransferase [Salmonella enterica]|nr:acyltransferase [Salmonella enterica]EHK4225028.1 acyltransferase [Salmonella enterica]EHQ8346734.1 acyltransferase [Salmonella enterica]EHV2366949.1 acyltransferase [Salmonella enterica]EIF7587462.1 acyltransferase [Salmonella enterica]
MLKKYRADIDGLRAIAVLAVIVFHLNPNLLPGGFVGVDIFFVISGYLITSIIYNDIKSNSFSYKGFYNRRIKRILPIFFVVLFATIIASALVMMPEDFKFMMRSAFSTIIFSSNIFFSTNVNYFAQDVKEYPLLHTWSLSTEEQYYFIFPIIIFLLAKLSGFNVKRILVGLSVIALLSFSLAIYSRFNAELSKFNYYYLPSRAWEMMIGSCIAVYKSRNTNSYSNRHIPLIGALVIAISLFISKDNFYPNFYALLPCFGAACILIHSGIKNNFTTKILSSRVASTLGLMSYSMYLWHWPIISIQKYYNIVGNVPIKNAVYSFIATIVLSYASLKLIETPIRKSKISFKSSVIFIFLLPSLLITSIFIVSEKTNGIPQRYGDKWGNMFLETAYLYTPFCHNTVIGECVFGDTTKKPSFIVMGDSHAGHFVPMIDEYSKKKGMSFEERTADACYPLINTENKKPSDFGGIISQNCSNNIKYFSKRINEYNDVVLIGAWSLYFHNIPDFDSMLKDTILKLSSEGKNIYIFEQIPTFKDGSYIHLFRQRFAPFGNTMDLSSIDFSTMISPRDGGNVDFKDGNDKVFNIIKNLKLDNVHYITPISNIPEVAKKFPVYNGRLIYKDDAHFNEVGSRDLITNNPGMLGDFIK